MNLRKVPRAIKIYSAHYYYNFLEFFDKSPPKKEDESLKDYVFRVDRKYALRRLDLYLRTMPAHNIDAIQAALDESPNKDTKMFLEWLRELELRRMIYSAIRSAIYINQDWKAFIYSWAQQRKQRVGSKL